MHYKSKKITLIDDEEWKSDGKKVANTLNDFIFGIVTSLNLLESQNADLLPDNIYHPTLKAILKWRNHSSVAISAVHENEETKTFTFRLSSSKKKKKKKKKKSCASMKAL